MSNSFSSIKHISDTALWVAVERAIESENQNTHFRDPFSQLLVSEHRKQIAKTTKYGEVERLVLITRTCLIDEILLRLIETEGVDTVLNLGSGLDTRPYRLSLPSSLQWIEVDFPHILSYKLEKLVNESPKCSLELVKLDLTDVASRKTLFSRINSEAKRVLVISEGLLAYLTAAQVASLATDLKTQSNFHWWMFELTSPLGLIHHQKQYDKYLTAVNAKMQFAPQEGTELFLRYGWKVTEQHPIYKEAHRFNRSVKLAWFLWLLRLLGSLSSKYRKNSGNIVLVEQVSRSQSETGNAI
ncbi:MAG: class I SAM-dependent methyltransferase [Dolichospermum sp. DEX189]|jgi:methyltransferase (TIGR00027 family)|nr:class I SAM-dependent methyltransferase [Dolichospermum sp. DEX189]